MPPLTILFTYYRDDEVTRIHHALLVHHNPGVPVVPLVANGAAGFLPGTIDIGPLDDPMFNVDRFPARWWAAHRTDETDAERVAVIESDCLVTMPLRHRYAATWDADVSAAVVATPATHPGWDWWPGVAHVPEASRAGVMPSGVILYSARALAQLSLSALECMAEARIGTAAKLAGLTLAAVPGLAETVHCREDLIRLDSRPGVYHPVKRRGGVGGACAAAHEFGASLLERDG